MFFNNGRDTDTYWENVLEDLTEASGYCGPDQDDLGAGVDINVVTT